MPLEYEPVSQVIERIYNQIEEHNQAIMEEKMVIGGNNHITNNQNISVVDKNSKGVNANTRINTNLTSSLSANKEISGDITRKITSQVSNDVVTSSNNYKKRESAQTRFYRNADRIRAIKQYQSQKDLELNTT